MPSLKTQWLAGLSTPEEKEKFAQKVLAQREIFRILTKYINQMVDNAEAKQLDIESYKIPNWSELQADQIGFKRACKTILSFIPDQE